MNDTVCFEYIPDTTSIPTSRMDSIEKIPEKAGVTPLKMEQNGTGFENLLEGTPMASMGTRGAEGKWQEAFSSECAHVRDSNCNLIISQFSA